MAGQTRIDSNLIDTGTDPNDIVSVSVGDGRYAKTVIYTATVTGSDGTSDWTGTDPFVATITVSGLLAADVPIVDLDLSSVTFADVETVQGDYGLVYRVEASADDTLKLYATAEPASSFDLTIKVVR